MRVFNTRPSHQNASWTESLKRHGFDVLELPLLKIIPLEHSEQKQAIKNGILELDSFSAVIFISQNAVEHALNWIEDFWPQLPLGQQWFAIGKKTEASLRERLERAYGPQQKVISIEANNEVAMNSEALLNLAALKNIAGHKILICKGLRGREHLHKVLSDRGATVQVCELYERQCPPDAGTRLLNSEISIDSDIISVFSGETLACLDQLLQKLSFANKAKLATLVPGERVAELARLAGFEKIITADNAGEAAMLSALLAWRVKT